MITPAGRRKPSGEISFTARIFAVIRHVTKRAATPTNQVETFNVVILRKPITLGRNSVSIGINTNTS
ncbi:hypothetical protein KSC_002240 [Ktedonobacter sp. SOSP1-52]|nr:hypothetical protein KSC_002240 [Ktedonobacter sp. SOSP1-52]